MRVKLGEICEINPKSIGISDDLKVSFIPMQSVSENGDIDCSDIRTYGEVKKGYTVFKERDVLFAKITPCMENGKGAVAADLHNGIGVGSTEFHVLRPDSTLVLSEWLYYLLSRENFRKECATNMTGSAGQKRVPSKYLEQYEVELCSVEEQKDIVHTLDTITSLIDKRKHQLSLLDELVRSRFVEMFGDPIDNTMGLKTLPLGEACYLKAGITTSADAIHEYSADYPIPCYGGNGIRGYVEEATQCGSYPIIGRQGALCGNVQLATGEFHATEHAVLVTPLIETNVIWLFHLLKLMDLYRFHTGAAQPGLAVKTLNTVDIPIADIRDQNKFAAFVEQTDKSKSAVQKAVDELETLKKKLMQEYFG